MNASDLKIRRPRCAAVTPPRGSLPSECAALLENRGSLRILDIGCGRAKYRQFTTEFGHRYVGVDLDSPQADVLGDAHALPFGDSQFDAALLFAVLQYSLNPRLVFEEAHRVIRPAGTLTGCVAFLEPAVWGSLLSLSAMGLVTLLEQADFRLEYIWPSWDVFEAVSYAMQESAPQSPEGIGAMRKIERALDSRIKIFRESLDYSGAIYFHAVKGGVPSHQSAI